MSEKTKYKTDTPQQIAKKYLQVTEFEEELAKDIEDYADSKVQEYKGSLELQAVSIDDNNELLNAIGKGKEYAHMYIKENPHLNDETIKRMQDYVSPHTIGFVDSTPKTNNWIVE